MWRNTDFMQAANVIPLQVKDGVCYGLLKYSAFAIDLATGNVLWEYDFRDQNNPFLNFAITYFYIDGTRMIIHGENVNNLYYLSTNTGKIIKVVEGIPYPEDRFAYFEGKLFSAGSRLSIVDINTGVDLLKDYDHSEFKSWNSGVTIDPLRRVMYCHDGVYAYCIKIPEL
jgi:outer membrane protein assembly factor BamB